MLTQRFMFADWIGIPIGFAVLAGVMFAAGYALGWILDVLGFRRRSIGCQLAVCAPLAVAIVPSISFLAGLWLSINAICGLYAGLSLTGLILIASQLRRGRQKPHIPAGHIAFAGLIVLWLVLAVLSLADLQIGDRLYFSVIGFDYAVRTAFTSSIAATGIPPANPFFFPGHPVALRYHYFWLLPSAVLQTFSSIDPRHAFMAGTLFCGMALICLVPLYLRFVSPAGTLAIHRRTIIGVLLLGVTGLDMIPALLMIWLARKGLIYGISPSIEWWNNQIDGWLYTMLWEPHYLASLVACLMACLLLWQPVGQSRGRRITAGVLAGVAFATAVGSGIYVAFVFAVFLGIWTGVTLVKRWGQETSSLVVAGITAAVLSAPYLATLRSDAAGGQFIEPTVRAFSFAEPFVRALGFAAPWQIVLSNVLFLPLNYFLELGFYFAVGCIFWARFRVRNRPATRIEFAAALLAGTSILICTCFRSGVIDNNDLGWRGFLPAQFVLLLLGAELLASVHAGLGRSKTLLAGLVLVGLMSSASDLLMLRFFPVLSDAGRVPRINWIGLDDRVGRRTYANRQAYEWLAARTPVTAIVQHNPRETQDTAYGLYAHRRTVAENKGCGAVFGGDPRECSPIVERLAELYAAGPKTGGMFESVCRDLPIDILVAKDPDGAWQDRTSWVWTQKPLYANEFVRFIPCRVVPASQFPASAAP